MASTSMTLSLAGVATHLDRNLNPITLDIVRNTLYNNTFVSVVPSMGINGVVYGPYRYESTNLTIKTSDIGDQISESYATFASTTSTAGTLIAQIPMNVKVQSAHTIEDPWRPQLENLGIEFAQKLDDMLINGAADSYDGDWNGLKALATAAGSGQKIAASETTTGGSVSLILLRRLKNLIKGRRCDFYLTDPSVVNDFYALSMAMGGNTFRDVMVPFAAVGPGGYLEIQQRSVPAFDGIPIFETDHLGTETTYGGSGKHRILAGHFGSQGIMGFYPTGIRAGGRQKTALGLSIDPVYTKETVDEDFLRARWNYGLVCHSTKSIAQVVNVATSA